LSSSRGAWVPRNIDASPPLALHCAPLYPTIHHRQPDCGHVARQFAAAERAPSPGSPGHRNGVGVWCGVERHLRWADSAHYQDRVISGPGVNEGAAAIARQGRSRVSIDRAERHHIVMRSTPPATSAVVTIFLHGRHFGRGGCRAPRTWRRSVVPDVKGPARAGGRERSQIATFGDWRKCDNRSHIRRQRCGRTRH